MRKFLSICLGVFVGGLLAASLHAATYQLSTGQTVSGDPVSPNEKGVLLRQEDGSYSERVAWDKFTEADLKQLAAANAKIAPFVAPLIEPPPTIEEKKAAEKVAITVKTDYPRLDRPAPQGLFKGLFGSGVTVLALILIYLANIFAGYEAAIFRARSPGIACGVAAVLPFIGPIIFLCLPTQVEDKSELVQEPVHEKEAYHVGEPPAEELHGGVPSLQAQEAAAALPATQHFARGQFTFNRRFFETKFPGFFTVVRREEDRDLQLIFKAARGTYTAARITRITAAELHIQVQKGPASEEVMIPFVEIQEVTLKHKDA